MTGFCRFTVSMVLIDQLYRCCMLTLASSICRMDVDMKDSREAEVRDKLKAILDGQFILVSSFNVLLPSSLESGVSGAGPTISR